MKSPPELILASTSAYRRALLGRLELPFQVAAPGVEETALPEERASDLAIRLARAKARAVASRHPDAWVIGSDQVAVLAHPLRGEVALGKPGTVERCREQLLECSGQSLRFVTAVAVARHSDAALHEFCDVTHVAYRRLDTETIARYVEHELPLDCAGGFKSEALGISLCESIDSSDPTALVGLPLIRLSGVLRTLGYRVP